MIYLTPSAHASPRRRDLGVHAWYILPAAAAAVREDSRPGFTVLTSASLRKNIKIPPLLESVRREEAFFALPWRVPAEQMPAFAGPDWEPDPDPSAPDAKWRSDDGGETYLLPPVLHYTGPLEDGRVLEQLVPGLVPDLPPAAAPKTGGREWPPEHFVLVASEYRRAYRRREELGSRTRPAMQEFCARMGGFVPGR